jgi:hypothetical protein
MTRHFLSEERLERAAWFAWLSLIVILATGILAGVNRSVTYQYVWAAEHWLYGDDLYEPGGRGFLYLPQAAILYIPFAVLPRVPSEIAWRILSVGVFAAGVFRLCRLAESTSGARLFPLVTCVTIPLAWSAARNGQATLIMAGLMMLAVHETAERRWSRGAAMLCLGVAFKPLTMVLALLVAANYRPIAGRLAFGIGLLLVLPYLTQDYDYVTAQYVACLDKLHTAAQAGIKRPWAQLFGMLETAGIVVPESAQTAVRIAGAGLTLFAAWLAQRRLPAPRVAVYLFSLSACYVLLFNPRTENNTYALVAPAIGVFCAEAFLAERNRLAGGILGLFAAGIVGSYEVGTRLTPQANHVWLAPLMCVGFSLTLLAQLFRDIGARTSAQPDVRPVLPDYCPHRLAG